MSNKAKITAEETRDASGRRRYHFIVIAPFVGKLSGHQGWSKSLNTWASKRAAINAGRRNYR